MTERTAYLDRANVADVLHHLGISATPEQAEKLKDRINNLIQRAVLNAGVSSFLTIETKVEESA